MIFREYLFKGEASSSPVSFSNFMVAISPLVKMDQPNMHPEEEDSLTILSDSFSKSKSDVLALPRSLYMLIFLGLVVPIPPNPTNIPIIDLTEPSPIIVAGLKVHEYPGGFFGLAFGVTYENFVVHLAELNPKTLTRPAAEEAWLIRIHQAYREWKPHIALYDEQKKNDLRKKATAQVCLKLVNFKE